MKLMARSLALGAGMAITVSTITAVYADQPNAYVAINLVSDLPNTAQCRTRT
jgi:hypothetical protein